MCDERTFIILRQTKNITTELEKSIMHITLTRLKGRMKCQIVWEDKKQQLSCVIPSPNKIKPEKKVFFI